MDEEEEDLTFSCPGCGDLMDDQDVFDSHEPQCPDLNEGDDDGEE